MIRNVKERDSNETSPREPCAAAWKTPSPMSHSLSQRLKRCSRYGTSNSTPKRPCLSAIQSPSSTSINTDAPCSDDKSPDTVKTEYCPSTPSSSEQTTVAAAGINRTPQHTSPKLQTVPSLDELRCRRTELRQSIASKEQTVRNLGLVKLHRSKNDTEMLNALTSKWQSVVQKAVVELHEFITEPRPSLAEFVDHLQLDHDLIGFNTDDESFD